MKFFECVPEYGCNLSFELEASSPASVESYTVKKNGTKLNVDDDNYGARLVMPFGQDCSPAPEKNALCMQRPLLIVGITLT